MIRQSIRLERADWLVTAFYDVVSSDSDIILSEMESMGCADDILDRASGLLEKGHPDTGLTFSNQGQSVMVICRATSAQEFANTLRHECRHLENHIGRTLGYDPYGEDIGYLAGEIQRQLWPVVKTFLCDCDCCRNKRYRRF